MMSNEIDIVIGDSRLAFIQGKYEESLKLAKMALVQDSNNPDAHQCAGNAYMSKADYDSAIKHYKMAVEYDANNGDRYFNLVQRMERFRAYNFVNQSKRWGYYGIHPVCCGYHHTYNAGWHSIVEFICWYIPIRDTSKRMELIWIV